LFELILSAIFFQIITVNATSPCFLNLTAGADMWENCGYGDDYLQAMLLPWEWITGGYFSMVIISMFVMVTYIKYHKAIYPILIGIIFIPVSFFLFPNQFILIAFIFGIGLPAGVFLFSILMHRTKEY